MDLSGKDISGKYLEKSEVENIIYIFEYDKKKFGDVCVVSNKSVSLETSRSGLWKL